VTNVDTRDFTEGTVWRSPYSGYVWLVLTSHPSDFPGWSMCSGTCLIIGQDQERHFSFSVGSVVQWDSQLAWCRSSVRIE